MKFTHLFLSTNIPLYDGPSAPRGSSANFAGFARSDHRKKGGKTTAVKLFFIIQMIGHCLRNAAWRAQLVGPPPRRSN